MGKAALPVNPFRLEPCHEDVPHGTPFFGGRQLNRMRLVRTGLIGLCFAILAGNAWAAKLPVYEGPALAIQPPLPIWPSDFETVTDRNPTFRFNGRFQASRYRIELARTADFADALAIAETKVIDTSGIAPVVIASYEGEALADGQYYWRPFAGNDEGFWTPRTNYRTFFVAAVDRDAIQPAGKLVHPYTLIRQDEIEPLRQRIARSPHLQRGWHYQLNAAYSALELDPPTEAYCKGGEGQHGNYGAAASWYHRHLGNVAFVGFVTGDERLSKKGVEMLMTACSYERWLGPDFDNTERFDPPWNSTLETAMMTTAVAVGYDLLYPHLTEAQRATVRESIVEKGIKSLIHDWADPVGSSQIPRHQIPSGNWVMVCACSGGIGALAILDEHPEARQWVRIVRNRVRAWLRDRGGDWFVDNPYAPNRPKPIPVVGPSDGNIGVDGGYKESIGYMNYAMMYVCSFADPLRRATDVNLFEHVPDNLLDHLVWSSMVYPREGGMKSGIVDFGDTGDELSFYSYVHTGLMKHKQNGQAAWLYRRSITGPNMPRPLLWYSDEVKETLPDVSVPMRSFRTIGHAVMRSGWGPEAPMAAIKFHQNRGHHDLGTFYLFGGGRPALIDSGVAHYGGQIYGRYLAQSVAHNVVLVDNRSQKRTDGKMLAALGTSKITAASGQLRNAYPGKLKSWTRDMIMLPDGKVLVYDRLEGKGKHQYDLVLHPENPFEMTGPMTFAVGGKDAASATISVCSSNEATSKIEDGYYRTLAKKYVRFNANETAEDAAFLTICHWLTLQPDGLTVNTANGKDGRWDIVNGDANEGVMVAVGSDREDDDPVDARLAALSYNNKTKEFAHFVVLDGKQLSYKDALLMKSAEPVYAAVENSDGFLRAHVWSAKPTRLAMRIAARPTNAFLNDRLIDFKFEDGMLVVNVPEGESQLVAGHLDKATPRPYVKPTSDLLAVPATDAPAYQEGVRTRTSTTWTDGVDALDGDPNTNWTSLTGVPMPQWLEIELPQPVKTNRIDINNPKPQIGRLERWDADAEAWQLLGRFESTASHPVVEIPFESQEINRFRVVIEKIDPANHAAVIAEIEWEEDS